MLVYQRVYHLPTSLKWEEKTHPSADGKTSRQWTITGTWGLEIPAHGV